MKALLSKQAFTYEAIARSYAVFAFVHDVRSFASFAAFSRNAAIRAANAERSFAPLHPKGQLPDESLVEHVLDPAMGGARRRPGS